MQKKKKFIDEKVNNIQLTQNLMCVKNVKNIQSNGQMFKIYSNINFFSGSCNHWLQPSL